MSTLIIVLLAVAVLHTPLFVYVWRQLRPAAPPAGPTPAGATSSTTTPTPGPQDLFKILEPDFCRKKLIWLWEHRVRGVLIIGALLMAVVVMWSFGAVPLAVTSLLTLVALPVWVFRIHPSLSANQRTNQLSGKVPDEEWVIRRDALHFGFLLGAFWLNLLGAVWSIPTVWSSRPIVWFLIGISVVLTFMLKGVGRRLIRLWRELTVRDIETGTVEAVFRQDGMYGIMLPGMWNTAIYWKGFEYTVAVPLQHDTWDLDPISVFTRDRIPIVVDVAIKGRVLPLRKGPLHNQPVYKFLTGFSSEPSPGEKDDMTDLQRTISLVVGAVIRAVANQFPLDTEDADPQTSWRNRFAAQQVHIQDAIVNILNGKEHTVGAGREKQTFTGVNVRNTGGYEVKEVILKPIQVPKDVSDKLLAIFTARADATARAISGKGPIDEILAIRAGLPDSIAEGDKYDAALDVWKVLQVVKVREAIAKSGRGMYITDQVEKLEIQDLGMGGSKPAAGGGGWVAPTT